ncbi:MAG TPA: DUF433 domain-containing protein [Reyranella sp.]|jgi:hypothetical protein|nr:DUF433 domain-containing protein [Reyranella sp.]
MASASQPAPVRSSTRPISTQAIVSLVAKGMTAREILDAFPSLKPTDIRAALLRAVDLVCDQKAALGPSDPVGGLIGRARKSSRLSARAAQRLATAETRSVRRARASRKRTKPAK